MNRMSTTVLAARARFGPLIADSCVVGTSFLVAVAAILSSPRWTESPRWLVVVAGLLGTAVLIGRRRWPVLVTLLGIAVYLLSENPIALVAGLYTTAVRARDVWLVGTATLAAVGFATYDAISHGQVNPGSIVSGVVLTALIVAVGAYVGARRDLLASLRERAERAEAERELRADQARAAERGRIAREMHDVLAHKVSLIALHAGALEVNADAGPERVLEAASLIRTTAHQTLEELRDVLGVLRAEAAPDGDLAPPPATVADIARLVEASRAVGAAVELTVATPELPDAVARAVYRIVQEGLTNVHKHARGAATDVSVVGDDHSEVEVVVANRRPVAAEPFTGGLPGSGAGLAGLTERVRLLGGSLVAGPTGEGGWEVRASLPVPARAAVATP